MFLNKCFMINSKVIHFINSNINGKCCNVIRLKYTNEYLYALVACHES